jgi:hypothetical protein
VNIGVAAHITAAALGGPRFDPSLTPRQRCSASNGIWLCQNDGKLVDNDEQQYPVALLRQWKADAEATAERALRQPRRASEVRPAASSQASLERRAQLLEAEIERNMQLTGRGAGQPERIHLDIFIKVGESDGVDQSEPDLMRTLYELRTRTSELPQLAPYGGSTVASQHRSYYRPAADHARAALQGFLQRSPGYLMRQSIELAKAQLAFAEERDRPKFEVTPVGLAKVEHAFTPDFRIQQVSGDPIANLQ